MRRRLFMLLTMAAMAAIPAAAQTTTFAWDPHPQAAEISGFHLWQAKTTGGP